MWCYPASRHQKMYKQYAFFFNYYIVISLHLNLELFPDHQILFFETVRSSISSVQCSLGEMCSNWCGMNLRPHCILYVRNTEAVHCTLRSTLGGSEVSRYKNWSHDWLFSVQVTGENNKKKMLSLDSKLQNINAF